MFAIARSTGIIARAALCLAALALGGPACADGFDVLRTLRRGVNILGYDGVWKGEIDAPFRAGDFKLIRDAGFDHVRVNFFGFRYMGAQDQLDERVLARLDKVIDSALAANLTPVLDQHDNSMCQREPAGCKTKLANFWRQIAARYLDKKPRLVFEILNEPGGKMPAEDWNDAQNHVLEIIRTIDKRRTIIVAALNAGAIRDIEKLKLPDADRNLIVTIHYYEPMNFTHQGASWSRQYSALRDVPWGDEGSQAKLAAEFRIAANWGQERHRPIYLGEFGVYDKAPVASRAAWMQSVARSAEKLGWGWAYWQFDHDFALFNSATHAWNQPLLDALMKK